MNRLYIVEGLPCSGKSTVSSFIAEELQKNNTVCFVDEGTGNHPADYEFHCFLCEEDILSFNEKEQDEIRSASEKICGGYTAPLSCFCGELFNKLLKFKIYDFLPWEKEYPVMLEKWHTFADSTDDNTIYVFNCVFLQNPMCETMMRFGFSLSQSFDYIKKLAEVVKPLKPIIIYLKNDDIKASVEQASKERNGWLESVIDYHVNGTYGKNINADGFDGYIACLEERQKRELEILSQLDIERLVIENPQKNWDDAYCRIRNFILQ